MVKWAFRKIHISGGFLEGLTLQLPPGLTCIIGARGSGKSTLAEALRYGMLGVSTTSKTRSELVQGNLSRSVITIDVIADTQSAYTIKRIFKQPPTLTAVNGLVQPGVDLDRGTFLPLDCYDSKEVEAIAETFGEKRRALLDDLRADDLRGIRLVVSEHKRALDANAEKITASRQVIAQLTEQIEEIGDVRERLAALPKAEHTDANERLLSASRQNISNVDERQMLEVRRNKIAAFKTDLNKLVSDKYSSLASDLSSSSSTNFELLRHASTALVTTVRNLDEMVEKMVSCLDQADQYLNLIQCELSEAHAKQATEYNSLQELNRAASEAVNERSTLEQLVARLGELELTREAQRNSVSTLLTERKELKGDYLLSREKISDLRDQEVNKLQKEVGSGVRVRVLRNADDVEYRNSLRQGLSGSGLRSVDDLISGLATIRPDHLAQILADGNPEELDVRLKVGIERSRKVAESLKRNIDPLGLEIVATDDQICIELNVSTGVEPLFKDASELSQGQKCTALLPLLLARRDTPLIIDQPEDNLDNHFIYETVVETINRVKSKRQMIFITHNPNIPVLAEADLVVVMHSDGRTGHIAKQGTLDVCRDEIIDLLEGGQEAFDRRRDRYGKR
jgi:ABC-type cobalamin/Fe3+-siderophores transport system ATPase subunit